MVKTILSKEGVKKILASHNPDEIRKVYFAKIQKTEEPLEDEEFEIYGAAVYSINLKWLEDLLNSDNVLFIKIDTSDERIPTTLEADNEL